MSRLMEFMQSVLQRINSDSDDNDDPIGEAFTLRSRPIILKSLSTYIGPMTFVALAFVTGVMTLVHLVSSLDDYAYAAAGDNMSCPESYSIDSLPAALARDSIDNIDCIRRIIDKASSTDIGELYERVSGVHAPLRVVDIPNNGRIEIFSIDYEQEFFWVLSFWLNDNAQAASVRAIYKNVKESAQNQNFQFRSEFFRSNADAVNFLKERYDLNEEAVISALEQSGAQLSVRHKKNDTVIVIYEVSPPDEIWNLILFGDKARFVLTFKNEILVELSSKPKGTSTME